MQLLTATAAYRNMMQAQVSQLSIKSGFRIADLGAGTGEFSFHLSQKRDRPKNIGIHEIDYVPEALQRSALRHRQAAGPNGLAIARIAANLDLLPNSAIPVRSGEFDAVLASLVVSYLHDPSLFLREAFRILKPGGSIVLSTLRRDADISKLFVDGLSELRRANQKEFFGDESDGDFDRLTRDFLNDASKILNFEEEGRFQFWDADEFSHFVLGAGFSHLRSEYSLGDPPQAVVLSACRPVCEGATKG
jgi:SAM-dependent methyltransferase